MPFNVVIDNKIKMFMFYEKTLLSYSLVSKRNLTAGLRALRPPAAVTKIFSPAAMPKFFSPAAVPKFFSPAAVPKFFSPAPLSARYSFMISRYKFAIRNAFTTALQCKSNRYFTVCIPLQTVCREGETAL